MKTDPSFATPHEYRCAECGTSWTAPVGHCPQCGLYRAPVSESGASNPDSTSVQSAPRTFADFINNATDEEKEEIYAEAMKRATERQNAAVVQSTRIAHSKTEYKRLKEQGADVLPPSEISAREAIVEECAKYIEGEANSCLPGSAADDQNWPFALQSCATALRRDLKNAAPQAPVNPATLEGVVPVRNCPVGAAPVPSAVQAHSKTEYKRLKEQGADVLPPPETEFARLKEIEHLAWHLLEGSEERVTENEIVVAREDYEALSKLLPEEHP